MLCMEAKSDAYSVSTKQASSIVNRVCEGTRRITENIGDVNSNAEGNEARLGETLAQVAEVARVMEQLSATLHETISEILAA